MTMRKMRRYVKVSPPMKAWRWMGQPKVRWPKELAIYQPRLFRDDDGKRTGALVLYVSPVLVVEDDEPCVVSRGEWIIIDTDHQVIAMNHALFRANYRAA